MITGEMRCPPTLRETVTDSKAECRSPAADGDLWGAVVMEREEKEDGNKAKRVNNDAQIRWMGHGNQIKQLDVNANSSNAERSLHSLDDRCKRLNDVFAEGRRRRSQNRSRGGNETKKAPK